MKKIAWIIFFILSLAKNAQAQVNIVSATVPFQNVSLNPQDTLQATFAFGNFHQMMCYESFGQTFRITWPYQGTLTTLPNQSAPNPPSSIFLSTSATFTGLPIDNSGTNNLSFTNTQNITISLNCYFTV